MVRASACRAGGRGFEPHQIRQIPGDVAQLVERGPHKAEVVRSRRTVTTNPLRYATRGRYCMPSRAGPQGGEGDAGSRRVPVSDAAGPGGGCAPRSAADQHQGISRRSAPAHLPRGSAVERPADNREVVGSTPTGATKFAGVAQLVEQVAFNHLVVGSIPAARTNFC